LVKRLTLRLRRALRHQHQEGLGVLEVAAGEGGGGLVEEGLHVGRQGRLVGGRHARLLHRRLPLGLGRQPHLTPGEGGVVTGAQHGVEQYAVPLGAALEDAQGPLLRGGSSMCWSG
jgi:hypothetical protein